jgi:hypothetical protein
MQSASLVVLLLSVSVIVGTSSSPNTGTCSSSPTSPCVVMQCSKKNIDKYRTTTMTTTNETSSKSTNRSTTSVVRCRNALNGAKKKNENDHSQRSNTGRRATKQFDTATTSCDVVAQRIDARRRAPLASGQSNLRKVRPVSIISRQRIVQGTAKNATIIPSSRARRRRCRCRTRARCRPPAPSATTLSPSPVRGVVDR